MNRDVSQLRLGTQPTTPELPLSLFSRQEVPDEETNPPVPEAGDEILG